MIERDQIRDAIAALGDETARADRKFDDWSVTGDEYSHPSWYIETCYLTLLGILEVIGLANMRKMVLADYTSYKKSKDGFAAEGQTPDGDPYSICLSRLRQYSATIKAFYPEEGQMKICKDLLQAIRDIHYVIADKNLFGCAPKDEGDVQVRIEGILKCFFPDLKTKPRLNKPIKNFEPDTGISSIATLIEYKFIGRREDVPTIADQILADTRGYTSKDWQRFIYIIYETHRFRPEKEWNHLLRESGVPDNTIVIVLGGEPSTKRKKKASGGSKHPSHTLREDTERTPP